MGSPSCPGWSPTCEAHQPSCLSLLRSLGRHMVYQARHECRAREGEDWRARLGKEEEAAAVMGGVASSLQGQGATRATRASECHRSFPLSAGSEKPVLSDSFVTAVCLWRPGAGSLPGKSKPSTVARLLGFSFRFSQSGIWKVWHNQPQFTSQGSAVGLVIWGRSNWTGCGILEFCKGQIPAWRDTLPSAGTQHAQSL